MSDTNPEAVAQEPISNAVAAEVATTDAAPEVTEPVKAVTEEKVANDTVVAEGETKSNFHKKGRYHNKGQDRGPQVFKRHESKSKFDPSKLPITDNPSEIRAQVYIATLLKILYER